MVSSPTVVGLRSTHLAALMAVTLAIGCQRAQSSTPAPHSESRRRDSHFEETAVALEAPPRVATRPTQRPQSSRPFTVERAAAVSPTKVFAVFDERLWRVSEGAWTELPLDGASVRDVTALNGTLWVLARGGDVNLGHVTVLRSTGGDDLTLAWDVVTAPSHEPRALAVVSERDFYVGGENPSLLRARFVGSLQSSVFTLPSPVRALLYMPDQMMAVTYQDGSLGMFRWGEVNPIERPDYLFSFSGMRESLMVRRDGAVWRGRVWEQPIETDRLSSSSGIAPVTAVTLRDERVVEVDASRRTRVLTDGHWFDIEATDPPGEVAALIGARSLAQGECVLVDRDGGVFELQGSRWVRTVTAPGGTIR